MHSKYKKNKRQVNEMSHQLSGVPLWPKYDLMVDKRFMPKSITIYDDNNDPIPTNFDEEHDTHSVIIYDDNHISAEISYTTYETDTNQYYKYGHTQLTEDQVQELLAAAKKTKEIRMNKRQMNESNPYKHDYKIHNFPKYELGIDRRFMPSSINFYDSDGELIDIDDYPDHEYFDVTINKDNSAQISYTTFGDEEYLKFSDTQLTDEQVQELLAAARKTEQFRKNKQRGMKEETTTGSVGGQYQTPLNVGKPIKRKNTYPPVNEQKIHLTEKEYMSLLKKVMVNEFVYNSGAGKNTSKSKTAPKRTDLNTITPEKNSFKPFMGNGQLTDHQRVSGYNGGMHDFTYDSLPEKAKKTNEKAFKEGGKSAQKIFDDAAKRAEQRYDNTPAMVSLGGDIELDDKAKPKRKPSITESKKVIKESHYDKDSKFKSLTQAQFDKLIEFLKAERGDEKTLAKYAKLTGQDTEWLSKYHYEYGKRNDEIKKLEDYYKKSNPVKENKSFILPHGQVLTEDTLNQYLEDNSKKLANKDFIVEDAYGDRVYVKWGKVVEIKPLKNLLKENQQRETMTKLFNNEKNNNKKYVFDENSYFNNFFKKITNENIKD
jgi:hypothetical protein